MSTATFDDATLLQGLLEGDSQALSDLYHHYSVSVYSLALRILCDEKQAEEVTQAVFLQLWRDITSLNLKPEGLRGWLLLNTRLAATAEMRQHDSQQLPAAPTPTDAPYATGNLDAGNEAHWNRGQVLDSALRQLPEEQVQVIELAFFQSMTHREIATHLALPVETIQQHLCTGLQALKTLQPDTGAKTQRSGLMDAIYDDMARVSIRIVKQDSPSAATMVEEIQIRAGGHTALQVTILLELLKTEIIENRYIPDLSRYRYMIKDSPEVLPLVEQAIGECLPVWGIQGFEVNLKHGNMAYYHS